MQETPEFALQAFQKHLAAQRPPGAFVLAQLTWNHDSCQSRHKPIITRCRRRCTKTSKVLNKRGGYSDKP